MQFASGPMASRLRPEADPDDPDWAPSIPSIWDLTETDPDSVEEAEDPFAPPIPMAGRHPDWLDPGAWTGAEAGAGRALAGAAEAVGRLDERLRRVPEPTRLAWRERLALQDVSALIWAEGVRLRPERLALADADRVGRTEDEDQVIARAQWARRRLTGQGAAPLSPAEIGRFLGRHAQGDDMAPAWSTLPEPLIPQGPDPQSSATWCGAMRRLDAAHPLTRSAAAFHLWRGLGLSAPHGWLEPGVIAARVAVAGARGGLTATPLIAGSERALARPGGGAAERLETWLAGLVQAADHAQLALDRIEAWRITALARTTGLKGKAAPALINLLAARPIVSAQDAAKTLNISTTQARTLLNNLQSQNLTKELTGQKRFRFWKAEEW